MYASYTLFFSQVCGSVLTLEPQGLKVKGSTVLESHFCLCPGYSYNITHYFALTIYQVDNQILVYYYPRVPRQKDKCKRLAILDFVNDEES